MAVYIPETIDFWVLPWSQPFRAVCRWFTPETQPLWTKGPPHHDPPRWVKPLLLQRWVAQAIAARFAWLQDYPQAQRYRYERESEPCWDDSGWTRPEREILRDSSEALLLELFWMEVERLLRIADEHPKMVGEMHWTCAALGASEHITCLYAELKRRHKAMQARALLKEALRQFVAWEGSAEG